MLFRSPGGDSASPKVVYLTPDAYAESPPGTLTGPGVINRRDLWMTYCGPTTRIVVEKDATIGGSTLALWAAQDLSRGLSLPLTRSPLEYGLPPDFKKLAPL